MKIKIKIMPNDSDTIAKVVIIDAEYRVLMLKRSKYLKKYPDKWDLPGGHLHIDEPLLDGLKREVREETSLEIEEPIFIEKIDRTHFFMTKYNSQKIKLSKEHRAFAFISKDALSQEEEYQKIAIKAVEMQYDKDQS